MPSATNNLLFAPMNPKFTLLTASLAFGLNLHAAPGKTLYETDFQSADLDKAPADLLVLDGAFAVKADGNDRFLQLPGDPLETFGVLLPPKDGFKENIAVSARILGTAKGRRAPTFSVGLCGVGGYKLQLSPAKKQVELLRGDSVKTSVSHEWKSGEWTHLRLHVRKSSDGVWKVEGKVWTRGQPEPADWTVTFEDKEEPPAGRASLWGSPFSGTAISYDDVKVTTVE